jgi:hypothetical protein
VNSALGARDHSQGWLSRGLWPWDGGKRRPELSVQVIARAAPIALIAPMPRASANLEKKILGGFCPHDPPMFFLTAIRNGCIIRAIRAIGAGNREKTGGPRCSAQCSAPSHPQRAITCTRGSAAAPPRALPGPHPAACSTNGHRPRQAHLFQFRCRAERGPAAHSCGLERRSARTRPRPSHQ